VTEVREKMKGIRKERIERRTERRGGFKSVGRGGGGEGRRRKKRKEEGRKGKGGDEEEKGGLVRGGWREEEEKIKREVLTDSLSDLREG